MNYLIPAFESTKTIPKCLISAFHFFWQDKHLLVIFLNNETFLIIIFYLHRHIQQN